MVGVFDGSPAAQGGVQPSDRIVRVNDRTITGLKDMRSALTDIRTGDRVVLIVDRGLGTQNRDVKLALTVGEGSKA